MSNLRGITVGDTVFVVKQKRRHREQEPGFYAPVVKVGRKYGYASVPGRPPETYMFSLDSGISVHVNDCNARANGFGWDVYRSEVEYLQSRELSDMRAELRQRLTEDWNCLNRLSAEACKGILDILKGEEIE